MLRALRTIPVICLRLRIDHRVRADLNRSIRPRAAARSGSGEIPHQSTIFGEVCLCFLGGGRSPCKTALPAVYSSARPSESLRAQKSERDDFTVASSSTIALITRSGLLGLSRAIRSRVPSGSIGTARCGNKTEVPPGALSRRALSRVEHNARRSVHVHLQLAIAVARGVLTYTARSKSRLFPRQS